MSHEGAARVWHVQPRVVIFPFRTNYRVSYVLSSDQQQQECEMPQHEIVCHLKMNTVVRCALITVLIFIFLNFYCKIVLINMFKVHLIKILTVMCKKTKKQKQHRINVNKNNVEYLQHNDTSLARVIMSKCQEVSSCHCKPSWQSIMRKVTWRRFDQSAKQLVVGQTTILIVFTCECYDVKKELCTLRYGCTNQATVAIDLNFG